MKPAPVPKPATTATTAAPPARNDTAFAVGQALAIPFLIICVLALVAVPFLVVRWFRNAPARQERRAARARERADRLAAQQHAAAERLAQEQDARQHAAAERLAQEQARRQARWADLVARFGPDDAARVAAGRIWRGATRAMVNEVLGAPADIETKVMKTKTKVTMKYGSLGGNRYQRRVYLDDGVVVGWEDK